MNLRTGWQADIQHLIEKCRIDRHSVSLSAWHALRDRLHPMFGALQPAIEGTPVAVLSQRSKLGRRLWVKIGKAQSEYITSAIPPEQNCSHMSALRVRAMNGLMRCNKNVGAPLCQTTFAVAQFVGEACLSARSRHPVSR